MNEKLSGRKMKLKSLLGTAVLPVMLLCAGSASSVARETSFVMAADSTVAGSNVEEKITDKPAYKITRKGLVKEFTGNDGERKELTVFKPELVFKGKYEVLTDNGHQRFSVRNTRVGFSGEMSRRFVYKFLLELSNNGNFNVLDLYFKYKPTDRLSFTAGQGSLPLFNSYTISPNALDFANRPFVGKFFNSTRDIGITAEYAIKKDGFPITAQLGIYNGKGTNKAEWSESPAYGARIAFGSMNEGLRITAKGLKIKSSKESDNYIWGGDLRYLKSNFKVETEVMGKYNKFSGLHLFSYYAQFFYTIPVESGSLLSGVQPALRWDQIGEETLERGFAVSRITGGVNFNLKTGNYKTVLRLNYEHFFNKGEILTITTPEDMMNKVTAEVMFCF